VSGASPHTHAPVSNNQPPSRCSGSGGGGGSGGGAFTSISAAELEAYNERAAASFKSVGMEECPNCGRRFLPERLAIHNKSCTPDNPARRVGERMPGGGGGAFADGGGGEGSEDVSETPARTPSALRGRSSGGEASAHTPTPPARPRTAPSPGLPPTTGGPGGGGTSWNPRAHIAALANGGRASSSGGGGGLGATEPGPLDHTREHVTADGSGSGRSTPLIPVSSGAAASCGATAPLSQYRTLTAAPSSAGAPMFPAVKGSGGGDVAHLGARPGPPSALPVTAPAAAAGGGTATSHREGLRAQIVALQGVVAGVRADTEARLREVEAALSAMLLLVQ